MKFAKSLIATAVLAVASVSAFAHGAEGSVAGSNVVTSSSSASVGLVGTGSASVRASNQGQAYTAVAASGNGVGSQTSTTALNGGNSLFNGNVDRTTTVIKSGEVDLSGFSQTRNISTVVSTQVGAGASAQGAASGVAESHTLGSGSFHTVAGGPAGSASGSTNALTSTLVQTAGNGAGQQNAGMVSAFESGAAADIKTVTTQHDALFLGAFIPGNTTAANDLKNGSSYANAELNSVGMGYTVATPVNASVNVLQNTTNIGSASARGNSSVTGAVASSF